MDSHRVSDIHPDTNPDTGPAHGGNCCRYAIYLAPRPDSAWWRAGCDWLGRDAVTGAACVQPSIPGVSTACQREITAAAARYGFHATLKAPFRLMDGAGEADLLSLAARFAASEASFPLPGLAPRPLGNFLALQLPPYSAAMDKVTALSMRCVEQFDGLLTLIFFTYPPGHIAPGVWWMQQQAKPQRGGP